MNKAKLGKMISAAKGSDRSIKNYAEACGVNQSIISRLINGTYKGTPKISMLRKLTGLSANPRGGITFEKLVEVAYSPIYSSAVSFIDSVGDLPIVSLSSLPLKADTVTAKSLKKEQLSEQEDRQFVDQEEKEREELNSLFNSLDTAERQLSAISMGVLLGQLAQDGVRFRLGNITDMRIKNLPDYLMRKPHAIICIENPKIDIWFLTFASLPQVENALLEKMTLASAGGQFQGMFYIPPDPHRKISIVVDSNGTFDYLVNHKGNHSYRGNLSVIQIDTVNIKILREEYIATYNMDPDEESLMYICPKEK